MKRADILLEVVNSETVEGGLSLRAWDVVKGRLSVSELRRRLREAGFEPGDVVRLSFSWQQGKDEK